MSGNTWTKLSSSSEVAAKYDSPPHLEAVQPGSDKDSGAPDTSVPFLRQVFVQGRLSLAEQSSSPQPDVFIRMLLVGKTNLMHSQ